MMSNETVAEAFVTDMQHQLRESLGKIRHCLGQLNDEQVWWRPHAGHNSIGNLILHLAGNLRQWVICGLSDAEDGRDRAAEFAATDGQSGSQLLTVLADTVSEASDVLTATGEQTLLAARTIQGFEVTGLQAASHSVCHFVGHTHQIIYITRLILRDEYEFAWTPDDDRSGVSV